MTDDTHSWRERAHKAVHGRPRRVAMVVVFCLLLVGAVGAQSLEYAVQDDFEDQSVDGWTGPDPYPQVANNPGSATQDVGNYSLYTKTLDATNGSVEWVDGRRLDLTEEFEINMTVRQNWIDDSGAPIRYGITGGEPREPGKNAFVVFDDGDGTYLATYAGAPAPSNIAITNTFEQEWTRVRMRSLGDGTIQAKVWNINNAEPSTWQLEKDFNATTGGRFSVNVGAGLSNKREVWLDSISMDGSLDPITYEESSLSIETRDLYQPGETHGYTVLEEYTSTNNRTIRRDVTDVANVSSLNATLLTVNETAQTMTATSDPNASSTVWVVANHNNSTVYKSITVAKPTVANLDIVPGLWRASAIAGDSTLFALLIATLLAVPAARFTSAFGGLALAQMVVVVAWFAGYINFGIAAASLFVALFIGLNLAANIDYMGGRSFR